MIGYSTTSKAWRLWDPRKDEVVELVDPDVPLDADDAAGGEEFEVSKTIKHRSKAGTREYLVRWRGYGPDDDTWQSRESLKSAPKILHHYERTHRIPIDETLAALAAEVGTNATCTARRADPDPVDTACPAAAHSMPLHEELATVGNAERAAPPSPRRLLPAAFLDPRRHSLSRMSARARPTAAAARAVRRAPPAAAAPAPLVVAPTAAREVDCDRQRNPLRCGPSPFVGAAAPPVGCAAPPCVPAVAACVPTTKAPTVAAEPSLIGDLNFLFPSAAQVSAPVVRFRPRRKESRVDDLPEASSRKDVPTSGDRSGVPRVLASSVLDNGRTAGDVVVQSTHQVASTGEVCLNAVLALKDAPGVPHVSAADVAEALVVVPMQQVASTGEAAEKPPLKQGKFSPAEDRMIQYMVIASGNNWKRIGARLNRSPYSVRARLMNILEPNRVSYAGCDLNGLALAENSSTMFGRFVPDDHGQIKRQLEANAQRDGRKSGVWTRREHILLMRLVEFYGCGRWDTIASAFGGRRTRIQCISRYRYALKFLAGRHKAAPNYELDKQPSWLPPGDPSWTSYELHIMEKIVNVNRSGRHVDPADVVSLFPGRSNH
ncbi:MAG: hypothetical protein BJ554DRAFT_2668, partial [Olpidium bornovanus]